MNFELCTLNYFPLLRPRARRLRRKHQPEGAPLAEGGAHLEAPPEQLIEQFGTKWDTLLDRIDKMDDAAWDRPGRFLLNGQVRMEMPISGFLWLFFFDAIHHRGQLSTYIRPMGGKVPPIYGPSGDDPMMLSVAHKKME